MNPEHESVEQRKAARWFEERQKIDNLTSLSPEQLRAAYEDEPGVCTCIDEGTDGDIRLAGSGILHPGGIEAVAMILRQEGVTEVTAHEHCGAAALAYRKAYPKHKAIDNRLVDIFAADWSRQLADALGVPYRYITAPEMTRPAEFHDASVVYLDMVGHFQPRRVPELPTGFVISGQALSEEVTVAEVELAASIALGAAGYGSQFDLDNPLTLVVVGECAPRLQRKLDELVDARHGRIVMLKAAAPEMAEDQTA